MMMKNNANDTGMSNGQMPAMNDEKGMMAKGEGDRMMEAYAGAVLAGTKAPLLDFTEADYNRARQGNKLIVLYFYANWCPICRVEFPRMQEAFDALATDRAIGFRVNYNDNETDEGERALAREFGVAYQHTKVFLKNGVRVLKSPESWNVERYGREISAALAEKQ